MCVIIVIRKVAKILRFSLAFLNMDEANDKNKPTLFY